MTSDAPGEAIEQRPQHRHTLVRMALMYTPLTVLFLAGLSISVWSLVQGSVGALFPVLVLGLITLAVGFQATTALRDLRSEPVTTRGPIQRSWAKGAVLWLFRSHYLLVARAVFVVLPLTHARLEEGDVVEIEHWPHTKTVISIHLVERRPLTQRAAAPSPARRR